MIKRFFQFVGLAFVAIVILVLVKTFTSSSIQPQGEAMTPIHLDVEKAAQNLGKAIQYRTISDSAYYQEVAFTSFQSFLKESYPQVFGNFEMVEIGNHSLILKWQGNNQKLKPVLFLGHQDVVPVEEVSRDLWQEDPFKGVIKDGFIWGRGAIDDKSTIIGLLEAATVLLQGGFVPDRSIYFAFGEDEEVGGKNGAIKSAQYFKDQKISFEAITDEGTFLTQNIVPGILEKPVALIGISEKGYLSLEISCALEGGHSSMPTKETAITVIAKAVTDLNNTPFPNRICGPIKGFIEYMGPEMPFVQKLAFSNSTLLKKLIFNAYAKTGSGSAMIHTTMATTILEAGIKDNVVPGQAKATINMRILPGETIESTLAHIKDAIDDDRVEIRIIEGAANPSEVSNYKSGAFASLGLAVKDVYPDALITPFLMLGATDSRHYEGLSDNIYKFMPVLFESDDLPRFHGVNERIAISNFEKAIQIYAQTMLRWGASTN
jgi:carboxypeptidase PM20D1